MTQSKAELEAQLAQAQSQLETLEASQAAKLQDVAALRELTSASLAAVSADDLDTEALTQAKAQVQLQAAEIAARELERRVGEQRAAIEAARAEVLRVDRAEMQAAGAVLAEQLREDLERLLPKFAKLSALSDRHQQLDAAIEKVKGYPGGRLSGCGELEGFGNRIAGFLENERLLKRKAAERRAEAEQRAAVPMKQPAKPAPAQPPQQVVVVDNQAVNAPGRRL